MHPLKGDHRPRRAHILWCAYFGENVVGQSWLLDGMLCSMVTSFGSWWSRSSTYGNVYFALLRVSGGVLRVSYRVVEQPLCHRFDNLLSRSYGDRYAHAMSLWQRSALAACRADNLAPAVVIHRIPAITMPLPACQASKQGSRALLFRRHRRQACDRPTVWLVRAARPGGTAWPRRRNAPRSACQWAIPWNSSAAAPTWRAGQSR